MIKYIIPLIFITSLGLLGHGIYVAYFPILLSYIYLSLKSKDDFLILTYILSFCLGIIGYGVLFRWVKSYDVIISLIVIYFIIFKVGKIIKYHNLKQIIVVYFIFLIIVIISEIYSPDNMISKVAGFRKFLGFFFILMPICIYNIQNFDLHRIIERFINYWYIFIVLIILQALVFRYPIFFTRRIATINNYTMTFKEVYVLRVYPYAFTLLIFYLYKKYYRKFNINEIIILLLGLVSSLSRSLIIAIIGYLFYGSKIKTKFKIIIGTILIIFVAISIGSIFHFNFRLNSFYQQFYNAAEKNNYSTLGTGRYNQSVGPLISFFENDNIWTGVGFISAEKSTVGKYFSNSFIGANHFITQIEVGQIAYFISGGIIGTIAIILLLIYLWRQLSNFRNGMLFKKTVIFILLLQIGGFFTFLSSATWGLLGMIIGLIIMDQNVYKKQLSENMSEGGINLYQSTLE